jgi:aspartate aminotransferase-like enzyme
MVFYDHDLPPSAAARLPRYLDLGYYASQQGIPFTFSSNLLHALHAATKRVPWERRFAELRELSAWLRPKLRELGFTLVGNDPQTSPAVITIALPAELNSTSVGVALQESGYLLSFNSEYLRRKNWIQICLMGDPAKDKLVSLLNSLHRVCFRRKAPKSLEQAGTTAVASGT